MQNAHFDMPGASGKPAGTSGPGGEVGRPSDDRETPWHVVRLLEAERRRRLVNIIAIGLFVVTVILLPIIFPLDQHPGTAGAVLAALVSEVLAYALNARNYVTAAAFVLLGGLALAAAWEIVSRVIVNPALDIADLRYYAFLLLPILLSCVLTPRRGPILLTVGCVVFTIVSLLVLPRSAPLRAYWGGAYTYETGSSYDVVAVPVVLEVLTGLVAWLGADSIRRVVLEATRADDLARAYDQIVAQARELEVYRARMREAVSQIQNVHAAISRGRLDARAHVTEAELMPLATSLNILLERLTRMTRDESGRVRMESAANELALALKRMWAGEPYVSPQYSGTALDNVLLELARLRGTALGSGARGAPTAGPLGHEPPNPQPPLGGDGWPSLDGPDWPSRR